ncbi:hypothetical protein E2562_021413 [Oryza meyeriana var. granulata]|uniref:Uncharacterized protein n=1 Tax=Oryza meyeriana var. granulata TaxID=110450 RepID=A0A6G1EXS6_9ORYZ|nr:hypothetical protein E2562_021413 [Oryza meyeriana var. granulata]
MASFLPNHRPPRPSRALPDPNAASPQAWPLGHPLASALEPKTDDAAGSRRREDTVDAPRSKDEEEMTPTPPPG